MSEEYLKNYKKSVKLLEAIHDAGIYRFFIMDKSFFDGMKEEEEDFFEFVSENTLRKTFKKAEKINKHLGYKYDDHFIYSVRYHLNRLRKYEGCIGKYPKLSKEDRERWIKDHPDFADMYDIPNYVFDSEEEEEYDSIFSRDFSW